MPINSPSSSAIALDSVAHAANLPALQYVDGVLNMDGLALDALAERFGTPCYVYSAAAITAAYREYTDSFASVPHQICYAVKANSNLAILYLLAQLGAGFDIVTGGELARVLAAGADPSRVVFSGLGKQPADIARALAAGIACFNVESEAELARIDRVAGELGKRAPISLRVNPDVDAKTHPYISTGLKENKFGISHQDALRVYQQAASLPNLDVIGIDCHIGSQLLDAQPFADALAKVVELIEVLAQVGVHLQHIDLGGGLGVRYIDEQPVSVAQFAEYLLPTLKRLDMKLYLEPGRSLVANAGVLLTRVDILKPSAHKNFAVVDAAMNDMIRPALYQAEMGVIPVRLTDDAQPAKTWDIVGAICETGDFLAKNRALSLAADDVLAMTGAGAYGFVMASNYNSRPRACEVLIKDGVAHLIRERETVESLWQLEHIIK